jgi:hypothetical protein
MFVNSNEEDLEWLMKSKLPGAYKHAHRKNELAEDRYFKALYDLDKAEMKLEYTIGTYIYIRDMYIYIYV